MRLIPRLLIMLVLGGCAGTLASRFTRPSRDTLVRDQLVVHSDFAVAAHHRLFEELTSQRNDLYCRLLPTSPRSDESIHVYLFENADRFEGFIRTYYPTFPDRRAFFVETDNELAIYVRWGDRMGEDLRHEVTHAYLHAVVPNMPQWLDEGIAKYYEVPRSQGGVNRPLLDRTIARLDHEHWQPDLQRLERFPADYNMTQDDYAEAWAWAHFLMESGPQTLDALRTYLAELRRNDGNVTPLSVRLWAVFDQPDAAVIEHIRRVESGK
jgi:hypothetical protein